MSGYNMDRKPLDKTLDLSRLKPYGDTLNDGKVQLSFTLPVADSAKAVAAAEALARKMGLDQPFVALHQKLDEDYTFFVVYGAIEATVDYTTIEVVEAQDQALSMTEINDFVREHIGRKLVVVGASCGSDAHTVGIDAILNMKGFAGHYGLERYPMFEVWNLGSQVAPDLLLEEAVEKKADVVLVSQTVTQKDIHLEIMSQVVDLFEAEGLRDRVLLICGGARISHELARELGYDAGFGPGKYAEDVATFAVRRLAGRQQETV